MRRAEKLLTCAIALAGIAQGPLVAAAAASSEGPVNAVDQAPVEPLPQVLLETDLGDIIIEVDAVAAPVTAANFLAHVDQGLYVGAHFYRTVRMDNQPHNDVKIEVVQGGLGFDASSPLRPIEHETTEETGLRHLDGTVSMARLGPGTASSEFFICIGDQPELDYGGQRNPDGQGFAAFGRVIAGMDVVRLIQGSEAREQMLIDPVHVISVDRVK